MYHSFGDVNIMHQIFVLIGIIIVYICMYVILVSNCVCACVCVFVLLYKNVCLYVCIHSRTIAVPANVYCWIWPDFKLILSYIIWSDLILSYLILAYLILVKGAAWIGVRNLLWTLTCSFCNINKSNSYCDSESIVTSSSERKQCECDTQSMSDDRRFRVLWIHCFVWEIHLCTQTPSEQFLCSNMYHVGFYFPRSFESWEISTKISSPSVQRKVRHSSSCIILYIDWLEQGRRKYIANAPELRLVCTKPSIYPLRYGIMVEPITAEEEQ